MLSLLPDCGDALWSEGVCLPCTEGHAHASCLGMDAEGALKQVVESLAHINVESWIRELEDNFVQQQRPQSLLVVHLRGEGGWYSM